MSKLIKAWSFYSELLKTYNSSLILLPIMTFIGFVLVYLVYRVTGRRKFYKYLPGLIFSSVGLFFLFTGLSTIVTPKGLDSIWNFCVYFVAGFNSLLFAWMLGIFNKKKKIKLIEPEDMPEMEEIKDDVIKDDAIEEEIKEDIASPEELYQKTSSKLSETDELNQTKTIPKIDEKIFHE